MANIHEILEDITMLFETYGGDNYDGEPLSQLNHMLQCGTLAVNANAGNSLVIGAFLHDIGHLLGHTRAENAQMNEFGTVDHEELGANYLKEAGFDEVVVAVVRYHVAAKRYLVTTDPAYKNKLSAASLQTFIWQGGEMTEAEIAVFEQHPYKKEILQIRRWDEQAKQTSAITRDLPYFMRRIQQTFNNKPMSERYKLVVFDMAGTTVNEDNLVYKTLHKAITGARFENITLEQVLEKGAGKEKYQAILDILKAYAGTQDESVAPEVYQHFMEQLTDAYNTQPILPASNAEETLTTLRQRGIFRVLNTGYSRETAQAILNRLNWREGDQYDLLVTANDVENGRPAPDMIIRAMKHFAIDDPGTVVKVGDSATDIQEGRQARCGICIGITTGAHTYEQLKAADPDYIINNLRELTDLLYQSNPNANQL